MLPRIAAFIVIVILFNPMVFAHTAPTNTMTFSGPDVVDGQFTLLWRQTQNTDYFKVYEKNLLTIDDPFESEKWHLIWQGYDTQLTINYQAESFKRQYKIVSCNQYGCSQATYSNTIFSQAKPSDCLENTFEPFNRCGPCTNEPYCDHSPESPELASLSYQQMLINSDTVLLRENQGLNTSAIIHYCEIEQRVANTWQAVDANCNQAFYLDWPYGMDYTYVRARVCRLPGNCSAYSVSDNIYQWQVDANDISVEWHYANHYGWLMKWTTHLAPANYHLLQIRQRYGDWQHLTITENNWAFIRDIHEDTIDQFRIGFCAGFICQFSEPMDYVLPIVPVLLP